MTLRGALIGFGEVARYGHWPAWTMTAGARIVAVVDRMPERRALVTQVSPDTAVFASLDDLAAAISIDFIDICTPPALHPEPMLEAIERGWHVLCEKPFLLDMALVDVVRRGAAERGVAVVPAHNWKYAPIVARATNLLRTGAIGDLQRVEIDTSRTRPAASAETSRANWRRDPAIAGGGVLMDHGWHAVYLALQWFRQSPTNVRASFVTPPDALVEETAALTIAFDAGEAVISLTWNGDRRRNTMRLIGTRGEIVIGDDALEALGTTTIFPEALSAGSHHPEWFAAMLPDVVAAFRTPAAAAALFEEAAASLSIIQQAYRSDTVPSVARVAT